MAGHSGHRRSRLRRDTPARGLLSCAALMTPRPHDALFRSAFEAPSAAAALLQELVSAELRDAITWESLRGESGAYIDPTLVDSYSDLLFSARLRIGDDLPMYLLLEHQSTEDPTMPLRVAAYQIRIWERWLKEHDSVRLPPMLSVVVSHAPGGWTKPQSFEEMFEPLVMGHPALAFLVPHYSLVVEDLAVRSDDALLARSLPPFQKLTLWALRDARDPVRLLASFDTWASTMLSLLQEPFGRHEFAILVRYLSEVIDPIHWAALHARIRHMSIPSIPPANIATFARLIDDKMYKEGLQEGRQEGLQEGRQEGLQEGRQEGLQEGRQEGLQEGLQEGRAAALRELMLFKFKLASLGPQHEARLQGATPEAIDRYLQRVLIADSLAAVFDD
jgi:hypothetical protein